MRTRKIRQLEKKHGFPCKLCGAETFEDAANLCRGHVGCCGDTMSKEVFSPYISPKKERNIPYIVIGTGFAFLVLVICYIVWLAKDLHLWFEMTK